MIQEISLIVKNPSAEHSPPPLHISASKTTSRESVMILARVMIPNNPLAVPESVPGASAGDAQPLRVENPRFIIKDIHQSTAYPGEQNTITVTFLSNYFDPEFPTTSRVHTLHIGNLRNFSEPTNTALTLEWFNPSSDASTIFFHQADWNRETGKLAIKFKGNGFRFAGVNYTIGFTLRNGLNARPPGQPTAELQLGDGEVGINTIAMRVVSTCQDMALWRDTQDKSCQDYANNMAWCQGLARVPALATPPADPLLVFPPAMFAKVIDGYSPKDAYFGVLFDATDACCVCQQAGMGIGEVSDPRFVDSEIAQSTPYPDSDNVISITLKSNVYIPQHSSVILSGLRGSNTASTSMLPLLGPKGSNQQYSALRSAGEVCRDFLTQAQCLAQGCCKFDGGPPEGCNADMPDAVCSPFGNTAFWQQGPGVLFLNLTRPVMAGQVQVMRFQLRNPSRNNTAGRVTINVTMSDYDTAPSSGTRRIVQQMNDAVGPIAALPGSKNGDARPLHVMAPAVTLCFIEQSSGFPGAENMLIFSLAFSVELSASFEDRIQVHGLKGAMHSQGRISLLSQDVNGINTTHLVFGADQGPGSAGTGIWKQDDKYRDSDGPSLTLQLLPDRKISAGSVYRFSVAVVNPEATQNSPDIWVVHSGQRYFVAPVLADKSSASIVNAQQIAVGNKTALEILEKTWIRPGAAQSTMYPGEENTITVSLVSSVMLEQGTWITITGLRGALPHDLQKISVGSNAVASSETAGEMGFGEWDGGRKRLVVTVSPSIQPGKLILLKFLIRNPSSAQESPQLFVRTSLSIGSVTVGANHGCTQDAILYADGGGGSDFSATFRRSTGLVEIFNRGRGFFEQPMIAVLSGGAGCIGNTFTAVLRGTLLATQTIQSDTTAVPAGKLAAAAGHAVPLRTVDKRLHTASVTHSTAWPHAVNKVTVSFIMNFALNSTGQPSLVLSNFNGIAFVDDALGMVSMQERKVLLHDDTTLDHRLHFGSSPSVQDKSAAYLSETGDLVLYVVRALLPEVEYRVSFYTLNTNTSRAGRNITVRVAELANARQIVELMTTTDQQDNCGNAQCHPDQIHMASPSKYMPNMRAVLAVYASSFYVARISQDNPYPSAENRITVAFASNVPLFSSVLHITGLRGYATATTNMLPIQEVPGGDVTSVDAKASWSKEDELLSVPLIRTTVVFREYRFVVSLKNPAYGQHYTASNVQLSSRGVNIEPTIMERETKQILSSIMGISVPGDQAPPQIRQPVLTRAIISQSHPYAAARNTLTVFFESNVDIPASAAISLSGFLGAESSAELSLGSIEADADQQEKHADQHLLFQDSGGNKGKATWHASTSSVQIYSVSNLAAMTHVALTFTLTNMMVGGAGTTIYAESAEIGIRRALVLGDTEIELCGIPGATRGEARPLSIRSPKMIVNSIRQSSTFPGALNDIHVDLNLNARISDCTLAIEGLPPSVGNSSGIIPLSSQDGTSSSVFSVGASVSKARLENGIVLLYVSPDREMVPHTTYSFSFTVRNPDVLTPPPLLYITACSLITTPQLMATLPAPILGLPGSVPGDGSVLKVYNPAFILKEIVQSTPWPGSTNTLTISIAANVDLYSKAGSLARITVSGLTGTQTNDNDALPLTLEGGSPFSSTGKWLKFEGRLELVVKESQRLSAGSIQVVSFDIISPISRRSAPTVWIKGSSLYQSQALPETMLQIAEAEMDTSSTYIPPVLKAKAGDAAPLFIHSPEFIQRVIGQSSVYPGAPNILTVTLACNIDLQASTKITLAGLGSLGSISLRGTSLFELDSTRPDSLIFTFAGSALLRKGETYNFKLDVTNPPYGRDEAPVLISASSPEELSKSAPLDADSTTLLPELGAVVGDAAPLRVKAPALIRAFLGQSSAFPEKTNTLTLTIASNFALTPTHTIRLLNLGVAASAPQSTQATGPLVKLDPWTASEISLRVNTQINAGNQFTWSFTITNPATPQSAPEGFVRVENSDSVSPIIVSQQVFSHTQDPTQRALYVIDTSFTVSLGQQNMALPYAINRLALTIGTTISLPIGSRITVSGLKRKKTMLAVEPVLQNVQNGLVLIEDDTLGCNHNLHFVAPGQTSDQFSSVSAGGREGGEGGRGGREGGREGGRDKRGTVGIWAPQTAREVEAGSTGTLCIACSTCSTCPTCSSISIAGMLPRALTWHDTRHQHDELAG